MATIKLIIIYLVMDGNYLNFNTMREYNRFEKLYSSLPVTNQRINRGICRSFEQQLNSYFLSENPSTIGLPSVAYFAEKLNLSPNYFGDLIKKETGKTPREHIQNKIIHLAKKNIFDTDKSISEIAYELGFKYPQHFMRLFKQRVGYTPNEYRLMRYW